MDMMGLGLRQKPLYLLFAAMFIFIKQMGTRNYGDSPTDPSFNDSPIRGSSSMNPSSSKTIVMFSGPSQSTSLISDAMIAGLNVAFPYELLVDKCPPEFLNPMCNKRPGLLRECFGSGNAKYYKAIWRTCSEDDLRASLSFLDHSMEAKKGNHSRGFARENFNGNLLLDLHRRGYMVFVAHRLPHHTFPSSLFVVKWYFHMLSSLFQAPNDELGELPFGAELVQMKSYVKSERKKPNTLFANGNSVMICVSHYIHFWYLLSVALENDIPHFQIEDLLLAPTTNDVLSVLVQSRVCREDDVPCERIAMEVVQRRERKTNMHADGDFKPGSSLTADLYKEKEKLYKDETLCHDARTNLMSFCANNIRGCNVTNRAYGYTEWTQ